MAKTKGAVKGIHRFCKLVAGTSQGPIYPIAARCLVQIGVRRPPDVTDRQFVMANRSAVHNYGRSWMEARPELPKVTYASSNAFLESYEWRALRMQALKLHGAKCQCCGNSPATGAVLNVDHIKPRRFYPHLALELSNLQVLCSACNHGKGNWDTTDWRKSA